MSHQGRAPNSALVISLTLLAALVLAMEIGYQIGQRAFASKELVTAARINSIQDSMFGIVALTLGFTLAASLERYRSRLFAVVDEANAIGTAYLRSQLTPESRREQVEQRLRDYLSLRADAARTRSEDLDDSMSDSAAQVSAEKDGPVAALFVASINEVIDSFARRKAALHRHTPGTVVMLLLSTFVLTAGVSGFVSGLEAYRPGLASYLLILVITIQTFVVVDLDRPRDGLIRVPQDSLIA